MSKKYFLIFFCLIMSMQLFSQEINTIVLKKEKYELYQGVNEEIIDWYLFIDNDSMCYLANLKIPEEEIKDWFDLRRNSDNIFKGKIVNNQYPTLTLIKENENETSLNFYVEFEKPNKLKLTSIADSVIYMFQEK